MKRFVFFIIICLCLVSVHHNAIALEQWSASSGGTYYFYVSQNDSQKIDIDNASFVQNGNAYIVSCSASDAVSVKKQLTGVLSEWVSYSSELGEINSVISKFSINIANKSYVGNITVIEGYSPYLSDGIIIKNKHVNIQIAYNNGTITVGYPIIMGSY